MAFGGKVVAMTPFKVIAEPEKPRESRLGGMAERFKVLEPAH